MPITEIGFLREDGLPDPMRLEQEGPYIEVVVGSKENPDNLLALGVEAVAALIDTGADSSLIDVELAKRLNLTLVQNINISTPSGLSEASTYMTSIYCPKLDVHLYGEFVASNLSEGYGQRSVLLGRDFLRYINMTYDGIRGYVTLVSRNR